MYVSKTTAQGTKEFATKREYMIYEVLGCIKIDMPYDMYVSYMMQWDPEGTKQLTFDKASYLLIKIRLENNQEVK